KYWEDGAWLAFGPGAHGAREGRRWKNVSLTADYVAAVLRGDDARVDVVDLSSDERAAEALFMGLRLREGVDVARLRERYGIDARARYGEALTWHVRAGLIELGDRRWALTPRGRLLANDVMAVFV
ncbi:MAG: coproporphyrinogen III oxidase family protein, partial [Acidobacteria bacterium]|nr:coproporphyrinogen III oxidase family protein [Acidobacteriota bacterium]